MDPLSSTMLLLLHGASLLGLDGYGFHILPDWVTDDQRRHPTGWDVRGFVTRRPQRSIRAQAMNLRKRSKCLRLVHVKFHIRRSLVFVVVANLLFGWSCMAFVLMSTRVSRRAATSCRGNSFLEQHHHVVSVACNGYVLGVWRSTWHI